MALGFFSRSADRSAQSARFRSGLALVGWVLLLPVCLLALGLWQTNRAEQTLETYARAQSELPETLAQVKRIAAEDPYAIIDFEGEGAPSLGAALAASQIEQAITSADRSLTVSRLRLPLAWGTVAGAALALFGGLAGLAAANLAGMRARRSRDQLVRSFATLRAALPFLLGILIVGFSLCAISATLFEAGSLWFREQFSTGDVKLVLAGLLLAATAVYGAFLAVRGLKQVFALYEPDPVDVAGRTIDEAEAPDLWRAVRDLAEEQGALMPDAIVVGLTEGFFVTEAAVRIWPAARVLSGRTLYVPASHLGLLSGSEVAAIIGHELAHFSGEDTSYSRRFAPIYAGLWRAVGALYGGETGVFVLLPAARLGFHALHTFDAAVGHWSRLREFEADRRGSVTGGPGEAASALIRTSVAAPLIGSVLSRAFGAPDEAGPDLVAAICAEARRTGLADPAEHLEDRQPHPTDSHPPTVQRIAALDVELDAALLRRATRLPDADDAALPGRLIANWPAHCEELSADFLDRARQNHAERRAQLETDAAAIPAGETAIYNNAKPMVWTMLVAALFMFAFGVVTIVFAQPLGLSHDTLARDIILAITGIGTVGALLYAAFIHRRSRDPIMVLTPAGLRTRLLTDAVGWTNIADFQVFTARRFALKLLLHDGAPLPSKTGFTLYSKIERRRRIVTLGFLGVRGMKPDAFAALVDRYLRAAYARAELGVP